MSTDLIFTKCAQFAETGRNCHFEVWQENSGSLAWPGGRFGATERNFIKCTNFCMASHSSQCWTAHLFVKSTQIWPTSSEQKLSKCAESTGFCVNLMLLELAKTILQVLHDIDTFTALLAEHRLFYFQALFRGSDFPSIFKVRSMARIYGPGCSDWKMLGPVGLWRARIFFRKKWLLRTSPWHHIFTYFRHIIHIHTRHTLYISIHVVYLHTIWQVIYYVYVIYCDLIIFNMCTV